MPTLTLIVAMSDNRTIGRGGALPWRLPADLQRFKALTTGHPILMGRKTFDSIGRPLPNRRSIVITRNPAWSHPGVEVAHSLDEALALAGEADELFVIGGEQVYREALPLADRLYLTQVHARIPGDAAFPAFTPDDWTLTAEEHHPADDRHAYAMTFLCYDRQAKGRKAHG